MTSTDPTTGPPLTPRWLHAWAVLTVLLALPLLTLGAEVTTKKVGMVDPEPVRPIDYLFQLLREHEGFGNLIDAVGLGQVVEHSHRTFGWVVGLLAIGLAVGLALFQRRPWLRWAGWAALAAVASQGVLGALRVQLNRTLGPDAGATVAMIHGCTAQLVFALLVSVALWTSPGWQRLGSVNAAALQPARRASLALCALMYMQIVFGALMRHKELVLGTRLHILFAFAVVAAAAWLSVRLLSAQAAGGQARRAVFVLWGLLALQLMLGLETLFSKFDVRWGYTGERLEAWGQISELVRSLHFLVGALTFATAVALALITHRHVSWAVRPAPTPVRPRPRQLEGAL